MIDALFARYIFALDAVARLDAEINVAILAGADALVDALYAGRDGVRLDADAAIAAIAAALRADSLDAELDAFERLVPEAQLELARALAALEPRPPRPPVDEPAPASTSWDPWAAAGLEPIA